MLLILVLLTVRAAFGANTAIGEEDQAFLDSIFGSDSAGVASDPPSEGSSVPTCRCVPAGCCGLTALTSAQTVGVGLLDVRSGLGGGRSQCLREGNVCCPSADIMNKTHCRLEEDAATTNGTAENSRCGLRESVASHGSVVSPGQFPWFVTVWEQGAESYLLGAGAIIHPRLVITAAHIVEDEPAGSLRVRLGDGSSELTVTEAALHADWGGKARYHDLAVLLLASAAPLGSAALPACLGPATLDPGAPFKLSGCQTPQIVDDKQASSLRTSSVQLLSRGQCEAGLKSTGKLPSTFGLHYSFICAKTAAGSESACRTESGAPLTCDDPGRPGRTVLVGLLSWNAACRGLRSWPDVYTRMADVDNFCWLERTVTRMLGEKQPHFGEKLCM